MHGGAALDPSTALWVRHSVGRIVPAQCAVGVCSCGKPENLFYDELVSIAGAVNSRRREFAAGRAAARAALKYFGMEGVSVPTRQDRVPIWPNGFIGSISHSAGTAVAVVAREAEIATLGIDIERSNAVEEDIWAQVLSPNEMIWVKSRPAKDRLRWATIFFCAKEAFYKAQFTKTGAWLEFSDVEVELDDNDRSFMVRTFQPMLLGHTTQTLFPGSFIAGPIYTVAFVYVNCHIELPYCAS